VSLPYRSGSEGGVPCVAGDLTKRVPSDGPGLSSEHAATLHNPFLDYHPIHQTPVAARISSGSSASTVIGGSSSTRVRLSVLLAHVRMDAWQTCNRRWSNFSGKNRLRTCIASSFSRKKLRLLTTHAKTLQARARQKAPAAFTRRLSHVLLAP
jgi:hypothetical protein